MRSLRRPVIALRIFLLEIDRDRIQIARRLRDRYARFQSAESPKTLMISRDCASTVRLQFRLAEAARRDSGQIGVQLGTRR